MLMLLALGCAVHKSGWLWPSTVPVNDAYTYLATDERLECRTFLFGVIPLGEPLGYGDLTRTATPTEAYVNVTIDHYRVSGLFRTKRCIQFKGDRIRLAPQASQPQASQPQASQPPPAIGAPPSGPVAPLPSSPAQPPPGTYAVAIKAYEILGWPVDPASADWTADVGVVSTALQGGLGAPEFLRAVQSGRDALGRGYTLSVYLEEGLPKE